MSVSRQVRTAYFQGFTLLKTMCQAVSLAAAGDLTMTARARNTSAAAAGSRKCRPRLCEHRYRAALKQRNYEADDL
jgi:hypothetical protein